jgi:hypothetical protein
MKIIREGVSLSPWTGQIFCSNCGAWLAIEENDLECRLTEHLRIVGFCCDECSSWNALTIPDPSGYVIEESRIPKVVENRIVEKSFGNKE